MLRVLKKIIPCVEVLFKIFVILCENGISCVENINLHCTCHSDKKSARFSISRTGDGIKINDRWSMLFSNLASSQLKCVVLLDFLVELLQTFLACNYLAVILHTGEPPVGDHPLFKKKWSPTGGGLSWEWHFTVIKGRDRPTHWLLACVAGTRKGKGKSGITKSPHCLIIITVHVHLYCIVYCLLSNILPDLCGGCSREVNLQRNSQFVLSKNGRSLL